MGDSPRGPEAALPLTPAAFHILLALADRELHGYGLMQEIARYTEGTLRIGPGTLYRSIKQLLADDWIEESGERPDPRLDDQRRRYYRLTGLGQRAARAEAQRLGRRVRVARTKQLVHGAGRAARAGGAGWPRVVPRWSCASPTASTGRCSGPTRRSFGGTSARTWRRCSGTAAATPTS